MIGIPEIRREIEKYLQKDFLKSEIKKIKSELKSMDLYKKIPEPTLKHISQLEDQFGQLSQKISKTQKQVDKEFNNALKMLEKHKAEASEKIYGLRDYAYEQKEVIEDRIRQQLNALAGTPEPKAKTSKAKKKKKKKTTVRKAASKKKASSKKKAAKKTTSKKTPTRKKKTSTRKK